MSERSEPSEFERLLQQYEDLSEFSQKAEEGREVANSGRRRRPGSSRLKKMRSQDVLDLHGLTSEEATRVTHQFLTDAHNRGLYKVMIIHGKGHHSKEGRGVLKRVVYQCLESSPHAGEHGIPEQADGGSGAVWVVIK